MILCSALQKSYLSLVVNLLRLASCSTTRILFRRRIPPAMMDDFMSPTPPSLATANLPDQEEHINSEAASPNAMSIDPPAEHIVEPNNPIPNDVDVVDITADDANGTAVPDANALPLATNCMRNHMGSPQVALFSTWADMSYR